MTHVLWALDLNSDGNPIRAHRIVNDDGTTRTTACGRHFTAGTHPRGWWWASDSTPPLHGRAVHCNIRQKDAQ